MRLWKRLNKELCFLSCTKAINVHQKPTYPQRYFKMQLLHKRLASKSRLRFHRGQWNDSKYLKLAVVAARYADKDTVSVTTHLCKGHIDILEHLYHTQRHSWCLKRVIGRGSSFLPWATWGWWCVLWWRRPKRCCTGPVSDTPQSGCCTKCSFGDRQSGPHYRDEQPAQTPPAGRPDYCGAPAPETQPCWGQEARSWTVDRPFWPSELKGSQVQEKRRRKKEGWRSCWWSENQKERTEEEKQRGGRRRKNIRLEHLKQLKPSLYLLIDMKCLVNTITKHYHHWQIHLLLNFIRFDQIWSNTTELNARAC